MNSEARQILEAVKAGSMSIDDALLEIKKEPLLPYFEKWSQEKILTGALLEGKWFDVGTIQRLDAVNNYVKEKQL